MADPFEALRAPIVPTDPDPVFARRLRARILVETGPRGDDVPTRTRQTETAAASAPGSGVVP